jgi:hypothetical protein
VQVLLDRRQRDVHNRRVEHDHQLGEEDGDQSGPTPPVAFEGEGVGHMHEDRHYTMDHLWIKVDPRINYDPRHTDDT